MRITETTLSAADDTRRRIWSLEGVHAMATFSTVDLPMGPTVQTSRAAVLHLLLHS